MNEIFKQKIIAYYFPPKTPQEKSDFENTLIDLSESTKKELSSIADTVLNNQIEPFAMRLNRDKLKSVVENLEANPPLQPDIKRKIDTYTTKVQFVELKFIGANFHNKKVNIPTEALPYKDAAIKNSLETKLSLFTEIENNSDIQKFKRN